MNSTQNSSSKQVISFLPTFTAVPFRSPPNTADSDQGAHFTSQEIQQWALPPSILPNFHLGSRPQVAGLIKHLNDLLKETLLKLFSSKWFSTWMDLLPQALILLNSHPLSLYTPPTNYYTIAIHPPKFHIGSFLAVLKLSHSSTMPFKC